MTEQELAREIKNLKEAYFISCDFTRMPYLECSEETFNDQVFLFTEKTEAETFCDARRAKGMELRVQHLGITPIPNQPGKGISGVRNFLSLLPTLDLDVVTYKSTAMDLPQEVPISDILPAVYLQRIKESTVLNPLLELTALYFCQQFRLPKERQDVEELKATEEEFSSNLVKVKLLVPIIPPQGQEIPNNGQPIRLNLKTCRHPALRSKNGELFLPIFTDQNEMQKYLRGQKMGYIQVPFTQLHTCFIRGGKGYLINPASFSIPLMREQLEPLCLRFGVSMKPLKSSVMEWRPVTDQ